MHNWPAFDKALARSQELETFLADPKVIGDRTRYTQTAKEHGALAKMVKPYLEYQKIAADIAQAEALQADADPEMQALIAAQRPDTPFITMVYVLFNYRDGTLIFSRSGHPYPLHLPRVGEPQLWEIEGSLLGVFDTRYVVRTQQLQVGDKVLLYTDGMDNASFAEAPLGHPSVLACASQYRELPIAELVATLARELFRTTAQKDDLTVLGVEMIG